MISLLYHISLNSSGYVVGVGEVHGVPHDEEEALCHEAQTSPSWLRLGGEKDVKCDDDGLVGL